MTPCWKLSKLLERVGPLEGTAFSLAFASSLIPFCFILLSQVDDLS
jgi:hypothetical protein